MKVTRLGSYQEVDEQGFLKSLASVSKIQGVWMGAIEALKQSCLANWGTGVHGIYVRGSCAKGRAIKNVSDIDCFAIFNEGVGIDGWGDWVGEIQEEVGTEFPFVAGVDLDYAFLGEAVERSSLYAFMIKLQAACVHGDDLANRIDGYRPNAEIAFQARKLRHRLNVFKREFPPESEQDKEDTLRWICRILLRVGMELVMERENRYTRDLYLCYESFSKHYPEKQREMYRSLSLAIKPDISKGNFEWVIEFGEWLIAKVDSQLQ